MISSITRMIIMAGGAEGVVRMFLPAVTAKSPAALSAAGLNLFDTAKRKVL